jgi:hypothetical protein
MLPPRAPASPPTPTTTTLTVHVAGRRQGPVRGPAGQREALRGLLGRTVSQNTEGHVAWMCGRMCAVAWICGVAWMCGVARKDGCAAWMCGVSRKGMWHGCSTERNLEQGSGGAGRTPGRPAGQRAAASGPLDRTVWRDTKGAVAWMQQQPGAVQFIRLY